MTKGRWFLFRPTIHKQGRLTLISRMMVAVARARTRKFHCRDGKPASKGRSTTRAEGRALRAKNVNRTTKGRSRRGRGCPSGSVRCCWDSVALAILVRSCTFQRRDPSCQHVDVSFCSQPHSKTIEDTLFDALVKVGAVSQDNADSINKVLSSSSSLSASTCSCSDVLPHHLNRSISAGQREQLLVCTLREMWCL